MSRVQTIPEIIPTRKNDPLPDHGTIYLITNKINGKQYVGQTVQPLMSRWRQHLSEAKINNTAINRAIRKYGEGNFVLRELVRVSLSDGTIWINQLEEKIIHEWGTLVPNGYNLLRGGNNRRLHSETKAKISESLKGHVVSERVRARSREVHVGNQYCKGRLVLPEVRAKISKNLKGRFRDKVFSLETRAGISAGLKGRFVSPETRAKISANKRGKPSNRRGAKHTVETRAKMSASHMGQRFNAGRVHTEQSRANMRLAHLGKKASEETKRRMSLAQKERRAKFNAEVVGVNSEQE